MKIQQFNPKIISITQLRRDIDLLEEILTRENEALVMRNQSLLFVAMTPEKYYDWEDDRKGARMISDVIEEIEQIRKNRRSKPRKGLVSDYVSRMREERAVKWKR
ncbi:hypothetical protein HZB97_03670 [Candidatus Gottesmanbacteria bacterium]|nr:hypothetical protein [Candidatus Gottesmanbacteria bacterium]